MKKIFKILMILAGLMAFVSCTTAPLTGRKQLKLVSDDSLVAEFISKLRSQNMIANDTPDGRRLAAIGRRISTSVEKFMNENGMSDKVKDLSWEFNLIKSEDINAFALPGGKIAFYTGIMPVLKTDAGVAFVMGHETGMIMLGKEVADALTGGETSVVNNDLVGQGLSVGLLKFSRTQEYEADKYGMIFMAMAGYNPEEAIKAQERMMAMEKGRNVEILSTHPSTEKRIEALKNFLPEVMKYYKK